MRMKSGVELRPAHPEPAKANNHLTAVLTTYEPRRIKHIIYCAVILRRH